MTYEDINRSELMLPTSDGAKKTYVETSADQVVMKSGRSVESALGDMYVSVKDFGAKGDGVTDSTDAIQQAIDFCYTRGGGRVLCALDYTGVYMIDATKSLRIKDNVELTLAEGVSLKAITNSNASYAIIKVENAKNVKISGVTLIGERDTHLGTTGEWGNGIEIRNSKHITIDGADISNCWGDGIYIGASRAGEIESENITIKNAICHGNRRLGMALTAVKGVKVTDSHFCDTLGTDPQDGVDIEPNTGFTCEDIVFERCEFYNNTGNGLRTSEISGGTIRNVSAINCTFYNNKRNVMFSKTANPVVRNCIIRDAREEGLYIQVDSTDAEVYNNKIYNNALDGVIARARSYRAVLRNNDIYGNGANGVRITSEGCILQSNVVSENVGRGLSVEEAPRCEISSNRVLNNGGNGLTVATGSILTIILQNYIIGNAKTTSGYNVLLSANDIIFKGNVVKKGENGQKPLRGLRLTSLTNAWVTDNNLLDSGENERIEVTTTALNVVDTNNYPYRTYGTTEQRPTNPNAGFAYFDTTIQKPVWWKGSSWVDATNTIV